RRDACATSRRWNAADKRLERRRAIALSDVRRAEHGGAGRRDPGIHRAPELPEKLDVDPPSAEPRVEPADDVAARARELELNRRTVRAGGHRDDDPRPRHRDADL